MTLMIELDEATEKAIERQAEQRGLTPEVFVAELVQQAALTDRGAVPETTESAQSRPKPRTGAELIAAMRSHGYPPGYSGFPAPEQSRDLPKTPAEALEYWAKLGVTGSYGDPNIDSPELARLLRKQAETREW